MAQISSGIKIACSILFLILVFSLPHASADTVQSLSVDQNPCLAPTQADYSNSLMIPSSTNSTLENNIVPQVQNGSAKIVTPIQKNATISLSITLNLRHQDQFEKCLASINDPTSPNYHHFLNSTTMLPYLPTSGHRTSIASFLASNGFKVQYASSPLVLKASAPASKVEDTFGVNLNVYQSPTSKKAAAEGNSENMIRTNKHEGFFYAADSKPHLPSNILTLVSSIQGLDNYTQVRPLESPCTGPYCPQGIQAGYLFSSLYGKGIDGLGQDVATVDCAGDPDPQKAIDTYDAQYNLPPAKLHVIYPDGNITSYDPGWASESMMDIEAIHTVAPGATIDLVYDNCDTNEPLDGVDYVTTNHIAGIVSNSWGFSCNLGTCSDAQLSPTLVSSGDNRLALDSAQGMTIVFASGDNGATPDGMNPGTDFPASDPNVLSVGSTDLSLTGCGEQNCTGYGNESGSVISGGGYSGYFVEPPWQKAAIGVKSGRAVPDVSILGFTPSYWVYSTNSDKCGTSFVPVPGWFGCAGTSLSAPMWAGYISMVKETKNETLLGNVAPTLYGIYNTTAYQCSFHDITTGNNMIGGGGSLAGYLATPGWDPVTGLGSPIADNLTSVLDTGKPCISVPEFPVAQAVLALSVLLVALYHIKPDGSQSVM